MNPTRRPAQRSIRFFVPLVLVVPILASVVISASAQFGEVSIHIDAARVMNQITPWMTGSCIEDVNHEIYGGLYAQRIFGESFEEPPAGSPLPGWTMFGGQWSARDDALSVEPSDGAKLARAAPLVRDGVIECDVRFSDRDGGNAGLILRVNDPRTGADSWTGYEVSISARDRNIHVSRHRNDWTPLKTVAAPVEPGKWRRLRVELNGPRIQVFLDGAGPLVDVVDPSPVLEGLVGVRTWQSRASYRNLSIRTSADSVSDKLVATGPPLPAVSGMWDAVQSAPAPAAYAWTTDSPVTGAHAQRITRGVGEGAVGIVNRGLNRWGIPVRGGAPYAGSLYLRSKDYAGDVTVCLQSADGSKSYAGARLPMKRTGDWERISFRLVPNGDDSAARFAILIDSPGAVDIDQVTLTETGKALFHRLPIRADIAGKLIDQGLRFLRYGGSMVNAPEYRWKKMLGNPERRPPYKGWWYPYTTNGFGIEEFVRFCEAAGITPAFAINIDETPEDAADLVEYLNGSAASPWGQKRAANGHPAPYNVHCIEIGNEEAIDGNRDWYQRYLARFKVLEPAIHARDPNIQLVVAAWWRPDEPLVKQIAQELRDKAALWDVHVGGDDLREGANVDRIFTEMERRFAEWIPGSALKACIFEENGDRHDLQRALGHAYILNVTERHGNFVKMDCPANCLQPLGQNDNGWNQGQVFFTPDRAWGMAPYYAQRMAAENYLPLRVDCKLDGAGPTLDLTATRSEDGRSLVLKVVNTGTTDRLARMTIAGFPHPNQRVQVWTLAGELSAVNTPDDPEHIHTVRSEIKMGGGSFGYTFPPQSYTVLRLRR